mmetsp:Transcript_16733/g.57111  ORF Transcript_16733/g.57111 Transcript_16733/m.57111 type:complete len:435 (+) Transcript_16733:345-1649(+)
MASDAAAKRRAGGMRGRGKPGECGRAQAALLWLAQWLARLLQHLVLGLEHVIELLGQEPERKWEIALYMQGVSVKPPSPAVLARRARQLAERGEAEAALRLYVKVLELEPDDTDAMDGAAELLAEIGDSDGAKELLAKSMELRPSAGCGKYVLMGHLEHGAKAVASFERALELLAGEKARLGLASDGDGEDTRARKRENAQRTSSVMAALAKVYLTDCYDEDDAGGRCERLLDEALVLNPDNPEACQALADLRLSQGRQGEALLLVRRTCEICSRTADGLAASYDFRTVTSRLLVELSQYEMGAALLEELAAEDDEDTEVWYLAGICYMMLGDAKACRAALLKAQELIESSGTGDAPLLGHIKELLERKSITEQEKLKFWNPRWWVRQDGRAQEADAPEAEEGDRLDEVGIPLAFGAAPVEAPHTPTEEDRLPI